MINLSSLVNYIPLLIGVVGTLAALFFKNKATTEENKLIGSQTAVKDAPLVLREQQDQQQIKQVDAGLQQMLDERAKLQNQNLTDEQKAQSWNQPPKSS